MRVLNSRRIIKAAVRSSRRSTVCPDELLRNCQAACTDLFSCQWMTHCSVCRRSAKCQIATAPGATTTEAHATNFFWGDIGYPEFLGLCQPRNYLGQETRGIQCLPKRSSSH